MSIHPILSIILRHVLPIILAPFPLIKYQDRCNMDARALLRAKKAGATSGATPAGNPYLKIDARGDQRCSICGVLGKFHPLPLPV